MAQQHVVEGPPAAVARMHAQLLEKVTTLPLLPLSSSIYLLQPCFACMKVKSTYHRSLLCLTAGWQGKLTGLTCLWVSVHLLLDANE